MKLCGFFFLVVLTISSVSAQKTRALFLGNSYTQYNNLPEMVSNMAANRGDTLVFNSNVPGGTTLKFHSTDGTSQALIKQGNWDYIVLQEQSQLPATPESYVEAEVYPYAKRLCDTAAKYNRCGRPMFYMTWGRKNGDATNCPNFPPFCTYLGMDSMIRIRYKKMAVDNQALLSPVGIVWRYIRAAQPSLELYDADGSHPSEAGTYIAAACFYTTMFRKNPQKITYYAGLDAADAQSVLMAVKKLVFDSLYVYHIGKFDNKPKSNFTYTKRFDTVYFINTSTNADSFRWEFDNGIINTSSSSVKVIYAQNGSFSVRLITYNCAYRDTMTQLISVQKNVFIPSPPIIVSQEALNITQTSGSLQFRIDPKNQKCHLYVQYGKSMNYDSTMGLIPDTISGSAISNITFNLSKLSPKTLYYYRLKIITDSTTVYSADSSFTTLANLSIGGQNSNENFDMYSISKKVFWIQMLQKQSSLLEIYQLSGQLLLQQVVSTPIHILDMNSFSSGIYWIKIDQQYKKIVLFE